MKKAGNLTQERYKVKSQEDGDRKFQDNIVQA